MSHGPLEAKQKELAAAEQRYHDLTRGRLAYTVGSVEAVRNVRQLNQEITQLTQEVQRLQKEERHA